MTSRKKPQQKSSKVPFYVGGGILALLLIAFITTGLTGDDNGNGSSNAQEYADVSVSGGSLPPLPEEGADPAVGMTMPEVTGESFDGTPVTITNDGRAKVILFLAHW
jgi:hypothetical protein